MKRLQFLVTSLVVFLVSGPSWSSQFEVCYVTAKVVAMEELSRFESGSMSVPAGVNADGKEVYSYLNVVTLDILDATSEGQRAGCQKMMGESQKVILDGKEFLKEIKISQILKLSRTRQSGVTPMGVARREIWNFQASDTSQNQ